MLNTETTKLECCNDPAAEEGGLARGRGEMHSLKPLRRRSVLDEVFEQ